MKTVSQGVAYPEGTLEHTRLMHDEDAFFFIIRQYFPLTPFPLHVLRMGVKNLSAGGKKGWPGIQ